MSKENIPKQMTCFAQIAHQSEEQKMINCKASRLYFWTISEFKLFKITGGASPDVFG